MNIPYTVRHQGALCRKCLAPSKGFTYIALLFAVVVMGVTLVLASEIWSTNRQREKEQELLFIGQQFREAIGRYYELSPSGNKTYPASLEDLLQDPRSPNIRRYLRKIYVDPMTGKSEWGLVLSEKRGIRGVYSLSMEPPIKTGNFSEINQGFSGKPTYSDWKFIYDPQRMDSLVPEHSVAHDDASAPVTEAEIPEEAGAAEIADEVTDDNSEYGEGYVDEKDLYK